MNAERVERIIRMASNLIKLFADLADNDGRVDLTLVSSDITAILRDDFKLPIPDGFEIESIKFRHKIK